MQALMIVGTVMQVAGALQSASAAADSARYNASIADRNAGIARDQAAADEGAFRRDIARRQSAARAAYGASGVTMEGSPLDVLESSATNAEYDALNIRYKGELKALGYSGDAEVNRARAGMAETQGAVNAGAALFGGFGKAMSGGGTQLPAPVEERGRSFSGWN